MRWKVLVHVYRRVDRPHAGPFFAICTSGLCAVVSVQWPPGQQSLRSTARGEAEQVAKSRLKAADGEKALVLEGQVLLGTSRARSGLASLLVRKRAGERAIRERVNERVTEGPRVTTVTRTAVGYTGLMQSPVVACASLSGQSLHIGRCRDTYRGSISTLSLHRQQPIYCAGMGMPVLENDRVGYIPAQ